MNTPEIKFLGWDKPAIELVAEKLEEHNEKHPAIFRRATVVVPTAESGRCLREYMAERAGRPILMPGIILAGQLIPSLGENTATELETMAAWLHVMSGAMSDKPLPWLLEVATQMQHVRKQLEQEVRTPDWQLSTAQQFVHDYLQETGTQWENTLRYEQERWNALRTAFAGVDEQLASWGLIPAEKSRAAELASPTPRELVIIACVPELSPLNRLYLQRIAETGAGHVEIWVNAPAEEAARFDAFGQPIPVISEGPHARKGWSECPIEIPSTTSEPGMSCNTIHPTGSVQAFGRKVRELAGGCASDEVLLASCDNSLSPMLVSAFLPDWKISMPEGRSLLATEAGRIPRQLCDVCAAWSQGDIGSNRAMEDFLTLLRNRTLQSSLSQAQGLSDFNRYLTELCFEHLPATPHHLQHLMHRQLQEAEAEQVQRRLQRYIDYTESIVQLIHDCMDASSLPGCLRALADALQRRLSEPEWNRAARLLTNSIRDAAALVAHPAISCPPQAALMLLAHRVEKQSTGALEGAGERDKAINLRGWRELCYARAPRVILAGMHDGYVPERMPADAYLPNAYRSFLNMTSDTTRCARDSFLLTALLHSRPAGAVHFVLASCSVDGTPIAPSSLLLRCNTAAETAERVSWLFSDPPAETGTAAYDLLPFITQENTAATADSMESVDLIAPGISNPYAAPQRTFSPSAIKNFLSCPLRFWMERLLKIAPGDALEEGKSEPDAAEYGTLLHAILQDITTRFNKADDGTDLAALTEEITTYAEKAATTHVIRQYGDEEDKLPIPIRILLRNLQKSVQEFARQHAQELCYGWEVILCEEQLCFQLPAADGGAPLLFDMRVDRVDRHRVDGRMRVIDYKTNDADPRGTHWEKLSEASAALYQHYMPATLTLQSEKGESFRWASVQLPLYAEALRQIHHLPELPETAFYNIPRTKPGKVTYAPMSGVSSKSSMTQELHDQAMTCVQQAAALMRAGKCLYSAESLGRSMIYSNFGALSIYKDPDPRVMCSLPPLALPEQETDTP